MNLENLKKVIPHKWKIQSYVKDGAMGLCVGYIDARDVMDLLDEVVGPENWQDTYEFVGDKLIAGIGIRIPSGQLEKQDDWVWKYDTGTESSNEKEKGMFSDAFKRAAVKWGVGRFLYDLDFKYIDVKNKKPVDKQGNIIWDLTAHFEEPKKSLDALALKKIRDAKSKEELTQVCADLKKTYEYSELMTQYTTRLEQINDKVVDIDDIV